MVGVPGITVAVAVGVGRLVAVGIAEGLGKGVEQMVLPGSSRVRNPFVPPAEKARLLNW